MFHERIRGLIDRHCLILRDETGEIGKMLAQCNPYREPVRPVALKAAREACEALRGRCEAMGIDEIDSWAAELNAALSELERRDHIEPWDMVRVMALQGQLAATVDELEADRSALFVGCTTPEALEVVPIEPKRLV